MMGDGLYEPLGQQPARRRPLPRGQILTGGIAAGAVLLAGSWVWWRGTVERPVVVATAPIPAKPAPPAPVPLPAVATKPAEPDAGGVKVIRPPNAPAFPGTFISVPQPDPNALAPAPDPRLVEPSRYGPLPRRSPDGATPAKIYARPPTADLAPGTPRVALFVGGMGLNPGLTAAAAQTLPPAVTLGFAPYGGNLGPQVEQARTVGHEVVLQVPMESYEAADGGPAMPRLLTTGASPRDTLDDLHWQMARFVGYAGVSSFLGAKFTAEATAFTPVLKDVGERGLFFIDDGTAPRSLAATLGPSLGVPVVKADVVIDALGDPAAVDAGLRKLEKLALAKGSAVGATTGLPNVVDRIAAFAADLSAHNVALVPVSALAPSVQVVRRP